MRSDRQVRLANPLTLRVGSINAEKRPSAVELGWEHLATHLSVYGGTGQGKSKFLELLLRQIIQQRSGACIIDPHGDLVEELLAYLLDRSKALDPQLLARIHYLDCGTGVPGFSFDPFRYQPPYDNAPEADYENWLRAKVESVARAIIRRQGEADFEGRPRLERFLTNVLYAVGHRVNSKGTHLPLSDAFVLLDTTHEFHPKVYGRIAPALPSEVRADFNKVHKSNPREQEQWVESTINRLRSFLSPAVKSIFAGNSPHTIDFREIVGEGHLLLVNLRRTRTFTLDQANAIGGLIINELIEAAETAQRTNRRPYFLFIDEASRFVGQDLIDALAQCRKWQLSICLAFQDLSSLRRHELDMTPKVLSQCGAHVSFQQKHPEDLDLLAQLFGYPGIDFTPLLHEVDRPDGYEIIELTDQSHGENWSETDQRSTGSGVSTTTGQTDHPNRTVSRKKEESRSTSDGTSLSQARGGSASSTTKQTTVAKYRTEKQDTGRLRRSVDDQFHQIKQSLRTLRQGQAMVSIDGATPLIVDVARVPASLATLDAKRRMALLDKFKERICESHAYWFPQDCEQSENDRLQRFLESASSEDDRDSQPDKEKSRGPFP